MTTTAKRQRQREGRVARMEAERRAAQKAARKRRVITLVVVVVVVLGLMALISVLGGDDDGGDEDAATTTTAAGPTTTAPDKPDVTVPETPPTELQSTDLVVGDGAEAREGSSVQVHYVGKAVSNGEEFDSSYERGEPITFTIGEPGIIEGWHQGVAGMREGGRRQLVIPPDLGYGEQGQPPEIGPNDTLVFVIDLLKVDETPAQPGG